MDHNPPSDWDEIDQLLNHFRTKKRPFSIRKRHDFLQFFAKGTAFVTFSYGIDGVSIEISKYAQALKDLYSSLDEHAIHLIGDSFLEGSSSLFESGWQSFKLAGLDGWDKWEAGIWFKALFRKKLKSGSRKSRRLAREMYTQAISIADRLGTYLIENQISLLIPVNIASNPGNLAATLGIILATEALGIYVLNVNHDFYWEGGKSITKRAPEENPGVRDHFFKNIRNRSFFKLFESLYPWDGKRWLQVNINARQSRKLIHKYGFQNKKVFEISTCIGDQFLEPYTLEDVRLARIRMGHILSDGNAIMQPIPVIDHISGLDQWMKQQTPCIVGARSGLTIDPRSDDLIILLQPTRIIGRKRIPRNIELLKALFTKSDLRKELKKNRGRQLILHISGPAPIEHQEDLMDVLRAYEDCIHALPNEIADQFFLAFSVGHEEHASFPKNKFDPMTIEEIYRLADVIVFPSATEGRGLPIIEASASGIPIICSQYKPKEVFNDVVGKGLPKEQQIQYTLYPEGKFRKKFLSKVSHLILNAKAMPRFNQLNRNAVKARYSLDSFNTRFEHLLEQLHTLD